MADKRKKLLKIREELGDGRKRRARRKMKEKDKIVTRKETSERKTVRIG